eukprot:CAMPEP_0194227958 /NCGR_PEP_ID=MMETSP0156-20130528/43127_1 /TAXON_ID=33649 /ORGANISM="Thalassionema nitzschioides, Strain L26-B" /LENGTH=275 /DNA_ID=CAMNT_0038960457 /DNA_START=67 /DNA_END=894 /DNA_ORIENTATION=+
MDYNEVLSTMIKQEKANYLTNRGLYDGSTIIDGNCRSLMVGWCMQIAKYFRCHHHIVAAAINILDRYIAEEPQILDSAYDFQLFTMASMYIAIKVHDTSPIDSITLEQISKGIYSSRVIEETELDILVKLDWRVNTPTAASFAIIFMELLSNHDDMSEGKKQTMEKLIKFQIDIATQDCQFLGMLASNLALTVVCNAVLIVDGIPVRLAAYQTINETIPVKLLPFKLGKQLLDDAKSSNILTDKKHSDEEESSEQSTKSSSCHKVSPRSIAVSSA